MADGPDPLGKRALYWMPIDQQEVSDVDAEPMVGQARGASTHPTPARSHARPAGKHALFSEATPSGEPVPATSTATATDPLPRRGPISVGCSTCGSISRVGVVEFLLLQFPVGAWLPRRTFDRWMTCPACRRRTWTSVTLSRWS
ncbi:MAG: hypothetical protein ABSF33_14950 [Acidimicrobiales bacterium]|jgi:hypothetical protein